MGADNRTMDSDELVRRRTAGWQRLLERLAREEAESWIARGLLPVLQAARVDPSLGRLFPFQSLMSLCFSRCSDWPYTNDCPAIGAARDGTYDVMAFAYPKPDLEGPPPPLVGQAANATEAVAIASAALTPPMPSVWIGTADKPDQETSIAAADPTLM